MTRATIHFGMPKTGTSALQRMLVASQDALATRNTEYPACFRRPGVYAHHMLAECVGRSDEASIATLDGFCRFLLANRDRNILISSESFTNCFSKRRISSLTRFLTRCRSSHELDGLMSLRRMDSFLESMYLHSSKVGTISISPSEYIEMRNFWIADLFDQIGHVRCGNIVDQFRFVKYETSEQYTTALIAAVGLSTAEEEMVTKYQNRRLGLKAQTALLFLEEISEQCGVSLPRWPLIRAMESRRFEFPDEIREYTIFTSTQREQVRRLSLTAAKKSGVAEYCDFFESQHIHEPEHRTLSLDNLQAADFALLREFDSSWKRGPPKRRKIAPARRK